MKKENNKLLDYKSPFKLNDEQSAMVKRIKEELEDRVGLSVYIDVYQRDYLIHPAPTGGSITFEVRVGNWKSEQVISEYELDRSMHGAFYYFLRRICDRTMTDLIRIGASRA